ncbi:MAG: TetR/AcrR family transcriptional regulator [Planctomycetota bacterium]
MTADTTQKALLDAAETLLGEVGFAAMSLRELSRRAGANLASAHYHFGSKEDLVRAVMSRRIEPVNQERMRRLDAIEAAHPGDAPWPARDVVAAFVGPALELAAQLGPGPCAMMGRLIAEQPPFLREFLAQQFGDVALRFAQALQRAVPGLAAEDAFWRLHFTIGAMIHTMQHATVMQQVSGGAIDAADVDGVVAQLTAFCVAGASAPRVRGAHLR